MADLTVEASASTSATSAESFASLQPMKSVNENKSISVRANEDRGLLPNLQHALGYLADSLRPECGPSFHRDIDFGDWEALSLEHGPHLFDYHPDRCDERVCTLRIIVGEAVYPAAANAPTLSDARARPAPGRPGCQGLARCCFGHRVGVEPSSGLRGLRRRD